MRRAPLRHRASGAVIVALILLSFLNTLAARADASVDLQVVSISDITTGCANDHTIRATIRNNGSSPSGFFNIEWIIDGGSTYTGGHYSIGAGQTDTDDFVWKNLPLGSHDIIFAANYDEAVPESDYSNNAGEYTFTATYCSLPPAAITLVGGNATFTVGNQVNMAATVYDSSGNPLPKTAVSFTVTGANPNGFDTTTNGVGQASFSYTGRNTGTDTITASSGNVTSNSVTVQWSAAPDTTKPGGTWISPDNGFTVTNNTLHLAARADDNSGGSGVDHVNFTAYYSGIWHLVKTLNAPNGGGDIYQYDWDVSNIPAGSLMVSFDVYDRQGNENPAPNGMRSGQIQRQAPPTPTPAPTPPPSPSSPATAVSPTPSANGRCLRFDNAIPGHSENICNGFLTYFLNHGLDLGDPGVSIRESIALFGYPISPELTVNGMRVQYFQRARLEYHPENKAPYDIELGLLGAETTSLKSDFPPYKLIQAATDDHCTAYALAGSNAGNAARKGQTVTGHTVCWGIRDYWMHNGGVTVFGLPISQEVTQPNGIAVQYFERARIEWHPENKGTPYEYELGLLGVERLAGFPAMQLPVRGQMEIVGYLPHDGDHQGRDLYGVDLTSSSDNQTIYPIAPGTVVYAGWNCDTVPAGRIPCYGNTVVLDNGSTVNGDEIYSIYTHLADGSLPKVGDVLFPDDKLGTMGNTGCIDANGANQCGYDRHLHFAVRLGTPNLGANALFGSNTAVDVWHIAGMNEPLIPGLPTASGSSTDPHYVGDGLVATRGSASN